MPVVADVVHVLRPQARLDVAEPGARRVLGAEQVRQQGLHPAAGEQRRRVVAQHERGPRDDDVAVLDQHVEIGPADLPCLHVAKPAKDRGAVELPINYKLLIAAGSSADRVGDGPGQQRPSPGSRMHAVRAERARVGRDQRGPVHECHLRGTCDFQVFVDLDGMDGLIHISELSWSHVNHPSEVLEIGQDVQVKVLDIDRDRQRISLGLKQTQSDPWQQVVDAYNENDVVQGKVTKVVTFGAFVEIMPGVEGLVHISELAQHHVENPREVVSQGDVVNVKIIEVDAERRRLSLSLKRVDEGDDVQPRADGQPLETPAPTPAPQIDLSEDVFPEGEAEPAAEEDPSEPVAEVEVAPEIDEPEAPAEDGAEASVEAAAEEDAEASTEAAADDAEASIEADAVDPTHQGPGDSEGHAPYAPEEAEQPET